VCVPNQPDEIEQLAAVIRRLLRPAGVFVRPQVDDALVEVADQGTDIAVKHREWIVDRFRLECRGSRRRRDSALIALFAKWAAEINRGSARVDAGPTGGSVFGSCYQEATHDEGWRSFGFVTRADGRSSCGYGGGAASGDEKVVFVCEHGAAKSVIVLR